MDPIVNPFAPGAGTRPPELAGRDELLEAARVALARTQPGRPSKSTLMASGTHRFAEAAAHAAIEGRTPIGRVTLVPQDQHVSLPDSDSRQQIWQAGTGPPALLGTDRKLVTA